MMNMIRPLAVLASLNAVVTVAASAQAFDEKHLCYEVVAEFAGIAGGNQAWGDAAALSTYAGKVRRELELFDWVLEQTDKQLDTAPLVQRN
jgi:hypothetical protein